MRDAVMVIPGIMGSELVDTRTGKILWGMADLRWYAGAWLSGDGLGPLAVAPERRGKTDPQVKATRLLRFPAFAPILRGAEPYSDLLAALCQVVANPVAVAEFPYDWRLGVAVNAAELAAAAQRHLAGWQAHPLGGPQARLVLVAHSMGGLVARYFTEILGGAALTRQVITLGTPFFGAVKAAHLLSTGRGGPVPLPHQRLQVLAATLPGLYDLLPSYRCVQINDELRRLELADVVSLGGDGDLATASLPFSGRSGELLGAGKSGELLAAGLRVVVGVDQPTPQALTIQDGLVRPQYFLREKGDDGVVRQVDRMGDGTVYRDSAMAAHSAPAYVPQAHGALARVPEVIAHVLAILTESPLGPPLGAEGAGIALPDVVRVGERFEIEVVNVDDPARATCRVTDASTTATVARPMFVRQDRAVIASAVLGSVGLYRVEVKSGAFSPVSQLLLVTAEG